LIHAINAHILRGYQSHIFSFERLQYATIDKRHIQN
jgi:hypothetical protein